MGDKLPPDELELYKRTDEILHYLWDPIGVAGAAGARDEYYSYLPRVFAMVRDELDASEIADYLVAVERDQMDVRPDQARANAVAKKLLESREWLLGRSKD